MQSSFTGWAFSLRLAFLPFKKPTGISATIGISQGGGGSQYNWSRSFRGYTLIGVRADQIEAETIRWQELEPGRLVHMRFRYQQQHFDIISVYQFAMSDLNGEQKTELMQKRKKIWNALEKLLSSLPVRSSVVMMGDLNVALAPRQGVAGWVRHTSW